MTVGIRNERINKTKLVMSAWLALGAALVSYSVLGSLANASAVTVEAASPQQSGMDHIPALPNTPQPALANCDYPGNCGPASTLVVECDVAVTVSVYLLLTDDTGPVYGYRANFGGDTNSRCPLPLPTGDFRYAASGAARALSAGGQGFGGEAGPVSGDLAGRLPFAEIISRGGVEYQIFYPVIPLSDDAPTGVVVRYADVTVVDGS